MKRIFISTNYERLEVVIGHDLRNTHGITLLQNNSVLYFNEMLNSFQSEPHNNTTLFLIKDEIHDGGNNPVDALYNIKILPDDYLMRHSRFTHNVKDFGIRVNNNGRHEEDDPYYSHVFKNIIFSRDINSIEKASAIIEFLFPTPEVVLDKKLDLLHSLLVPPVDTTEANSQWADIKNTVLKARASGINVSLATNEDEFTTFQKAVNGINDPFDPDYIKAIAKLRDAILPS